MNKNIDRYSMGFSVACEISKQNFKRTIFRSKMPAFKKLLTLSGLLLFYSLSVSAQDCNTITNTNTDNYSVIVSNSTTGLFSYVNYKERAITPKSDDYATIGSTLLGGTGMLTVKYESIVHPEGTFAGFEIKEGGGLLSLDLLGALKIETLNSLGAVLETKTGAGHLLGLSLLTTSSNTQYLGFTTTKPFSGIRITYDIGLVSALVNLRVYGAVVKTMCENPAGWICNTVDGLINPTYPVNIDMKNTGVSGVGTLLGNVTNAENLIDTISGNFAKIAGLNLLTTASITVKKELSKFTAESNFVGFDIQGTGSLLDLGLLSGLSISVMKDGVEVQSRNNTQLLKLNLLPGTGERITLGFTPTVEFDAIKISLNGGLANTSLLGELLVYSAVVKHFCPVTTNPDVAVTNINVAVSGNAQTNDNVPANTEYSLNAAPNTPNGSDPSFMINSDGSYIFMGDMAGVYTYILNVCTEAAPSCETETLIITVSDPIEINFPVALADIVHVTEGNSIVTPSLANDRPGKNGAPLDPSTTTIVSNPNNGTASVSSLGEIIYTPNSGFIGTDFLVYQVCDENNNCANAEQRIHVMPLSMNTTSASPDYYTSMQGSAIIGNVSLNDMDPQNDNQIVTFLDSPTPDQGTLTSNPDGSFEFIPNPTFFGPIQLTYQTCDDGVPSACAKETLNLLYDMGSPDLSTSISFYNSSIIGTSNVSVISSIVNFGVSPTTGLISVYISKDPIATFNFDPDATKIGIRAVNNTNWTFDDTSSAFYYILTSNTEIPVNGGQRIGFTTTINPNGAIGEVNTSIDLEPGAGGDLDESNNSNISTLTYFP